MATPSFDKVKIMHTETNNLKGQFLEITIKKNSINKKLTYRVSVNVIQTLCIPRKQTENRNSTSQQPQSSPPMKPLYLNTLNCASVPSPVT